MRRWNGWGEEKTTYPLHDSAARYLVTAVGDWAVLPDAPFQDVLASVPESRLPAHPRITTDPVERLRHARGQSLPDWVAIRSGRLGAFPDGAAYPTSDDDVHALLDFARRTGARLIPYGGGTSVVGHINPRPGDAPTLTVDMSRLYRLIDLDEPSHLATFEAGASGPEIESQLRLRGYTLGHYPQSFEFSTLGGWIATRSSGQQSYHYGRIENLFAGGHVETPLGALDLPLLPASAAGPDLRQTILGSEGRLGIITRATVRIRPLPASENFYGVFFHDWESGVAAVRRIAQAAVPVSMLRLSDAQETETALMLSGRDRLVRWADRGLRTVGYGPERCLLLFGVTGHRGLTTLAYSEAMDIIRANGGLSVGAAIGTQWRKTRFLTPYLRNTLWERGYAIDTLETALPWSQVVPTAAAIKDAIRGGLADAGERVLVFAHLSHVYADGASIYVTYLFRRAADPDETLRRWQKLKAGASQIVVAHGGTISHQHGVGVDHAPYLAAEKGELGMRLLQSMQRTLDPDGLFNPGNLLGDVKGAS
ncbi:MAG: FAD-binding oxidoreductase [Chloroflexota bacterium]